MKKGLDLEDPLQKNQNSGSGGGIEVKRQKRSTTANRISIFSQLRKGG
ncbi:MAG: hypothetical protein ACHQUC_02625 [Chlamydiales bacterium]